MLISQRSKCHSDNSNLLKAVQVLKEKSKKESIHVEEYEKCKSKKVSGLRAYMYGDLFPQDICSLTECIIREIISRGVSWATSVKKDIAVCGGVTNSGAELVYNEIIHCELASYVDLAPSCSEHQSPCRVCTAKATLYTTGGVKNLKVIKQ